MPDFSSHAGQFTASRKQLHRMAAITALLKEREWVTMTAIRRKLAETEFTGGVYLGCGNRTVQRDIKALQSEYHAPILYSKSEAAYRLSNREWTFQVPALLNPDELLALVIGGKICKDIFPGSISRRVTRAVEEVLRYNEADALTSELLESLKVLSNGNASDRQEEVFLVAFDAWQHRHLLRIAYADRGGETYTRDIEPHALVFQDMRWSIKGFCHLRNEQRTFHLSRISAAAMLPECFKPSQEIIASVTPDRFLDFEKLRDVTLAVNEEGRQFATTYPLHSAQSFVRNDDGSHILRVPAVSLEQLVPWVLRQMGNARPLSPLQAVKAVRDAICRLADVCDAPVNAKGRHRKKDSSPKYPGA